MTSMSTGLKIVNWLKRLFISNRGVGDDALIYYVKGHKCGAITRVRINPSSELSRDDDDTFFVRKVVVDSQCYGRVEIVLRFDAAYREISRHISGGEFTTHEEWQAQRHRRIGQP
jgi:hypothetical protein